MLLIDPILLPGLQDADRTFAMELVALVRGMQHAVAERKELGHVSDSPAQLLTGMITGIEVCPLLLHLLLEIYMDVVCINILVSSVFSKLMPTCV